MSASRVDILNVSFLDWSGERKIAGGAERYVLELASIVRSIGFVPRLLQNASVPFSRSVEGIEVVGVPVGPAIDFAALSHGFGREIEGASLVIASQLELACALPPPVPVVGISHGIWWDDPQRRIHDPDPDRSLLFAALDRVACCACVDTNFINWVRATRGGLQDKLAYLPNFVALDRFAPQARSFEGALRVLFPRRLARERGLDDVLEAFERLLPRHRDLELWLCGDGGESEASRVRAFVARHAARVRWTALPAEAMPQAYGGSDVVIVPTLFGEGTSLSCLEAMASHHAVIATQVGGLPNLIIDGFNGLLVAPGAAAIEQAVEALLADRGLARRLAATALDVSRAFGHARWRARWLALLQHALSGRHGVPGFAVTLDTGTAATGAQEPASRPEWLSAALRDASMERDRLEQSLRMVVAERDAARRLREQAEQRLDAAKRDAEVTRRERDAMQGTAQLAQEQRDQLTAQVAWHRQEHAVFEASSRERMERLQRDTQAALARDAQALALARGEQAALVEEAERMREGATALRQQHAQDVAVLNGIVSARDEAIAWLRDELALAYDRFARHRHSLKLLGADLGYEVLRRHPRVMDAAKRVLPQRLRDRMKRPVVAGNRLATPPVVSAEPTAVPVPARGESPPVPPPVAAEAHRLAAPRDILPTHRGYDVVCFANIEWDQRYQRPQHMIGAFAADGHRVFYVVASRTPPPGELYHLESVAQNVTQVTLAVPAPQDFYGQALSAENGEAMARALGALACDCKLRATVVIVHLPYWTALALHLRKRLGWRVVYDCMDEWADFPAIGPELLALEERLVARAELVTVTAAQLEQKWKDRARRCLLVRNGVDFAFFSRECAPNDLLAGMQRPIVGYYGALAEWVDLELVAAVARAHPEWSFVLVGDVFVKDLAGLDALPNVTMTGRRPYAEMPKYLYHFDVCLIPFKLNDVTHAVDPVKFYEYISAGKPVVSVPLKEMEGYREYAYFAEGVEAFGAAIGEALAERDPAVWQRRVALARDNDWSQRYQRTREAIEAVHPLVSIVVVSYLNVELTRLCIESVLDTQTWPRIELIVVDNASTDGTRAYLRYLARERPEVRVILNDENRGFAAANNQGVAVTRGDYIVLLNNDTVVPRGWLEPMIAHLADPTIGLVGPVTNFVGNEARIPVDYASLDGMQAFADRHTQAHAGRVFDINVLAMFCVMIKRTVMERIGLLDERFGVGMFEDDDYSRRVQAAGLRTVCAEDAFVHHFGQAAFKKLIETGEYDRLWAANQRHYEEKWGKWTQHKLRSDVPEVSEGD